MVVPLINSALLFGMEKAINSVLNLDPSARKKLNTLSGKTIAIQCQQPAFGMMILVGNQGISLSQFIDSDSNATVTGTASSLIQLLINQSSGFHHKNISIQGDAELLHALQKIMLKLDIDWEYHLSRFIGDIPTQMFRNSLDTSEEFVRKSTESLKLDFEEYLHEEKKWLPANEQLQEFYSLVDNLRLRTDRLQARVNKLENQL